MATCLAIACTYASILPAQAGAFDFNDEGWEGTSELLALAREKLGKKRVELTATIHWDRIAPSDALLILHPEQELEYPEVAAFLAAGGRLALLDDYGRGDAILEKFRIHRVQAPIQPAETLRQNPNLPVAVPAVQMVAGRERGRHPIVASVERLMTNHPTGLRTEEGVQLTPVLEIPARGETSTLLAVIGVIGDAERCGLLGWEAQPVTRSSAPTAKCGRLFTAGDPSVLINHMLRYPGNRAFASGLIDYLLEDDAWGRRGGTLYLVANDFSQRGLYGGASGLRRLLGSWLDDFEQLFERARSEGLPDPLAVALAAVLALGAALWMGRAATRLYRRPEPRYARATPLVAQGGVAGRAAVLAAPTTHRALAVLELKAALEETLRERLGLPSSASRSRIVEEIGHTGRLGRKSAKDLARLLSEMARVEQAVAASKRIRIAQRDVQRMHDTMKSILADLEGLDEGRR